jgi:putative MFS transporter
MAEAAEPDLKFEKTEPWHFRARIIIGVATFFDAFDALAIAYVLPVLVAKWSLTPTQIGFGIALGYVGQMIGAVSAGFFADRYGRLRVLMGTVAILSLCSFLMAFSWSWSSLLVIRLIQGIGLGGEVPVAASYIRACPQDRLSVSAGIEKGGAKRSKTTVLPQIGVL